MKITPLNFGKKAMFFQFVNHLINNIKMNLIRIFGIYKNIILINNDKDIALLSQNLINIILETFRCSEKPKKHYLILEMTVLG